MKVYIIIIILANFIHAQNFTINYTHSFGNFENANCFTLINNNFIILSSEDNQMFKINKKGELLKSNGGYGWASAQFDEPMDIDSDLLKIYVADKNNSRIQVFDKDLNFISSINSKNSFEFEYPTVCKISNSGDIYFLDSENKIIYQLNTSNFEFNDIINPNSSKSLFENPGCFDLDNESNIYLLHNNKINVYDQFGNDIKVVNLDFEPTNIHVSKKYILLNTHQEVYISELSPEINFTKIIESEVTIQQTLLSNSEIFILTSDKIKVYKIEK